MQILTEILWVKEVSSWKKVLFCLLNFYSMNIEGFGLALFSQNFNKKDQIKISHQLIFEAFASIFFIFYLTFLLLHPKKSSNNISKRACSVFSVYTPPTWGCDWPALWMPVVEGGGPKHLLQLPRHAPRYTTPVIKRWELIKDKGSSWKVALSTSSNSRTTRDTPHL